MILREDGSVWSTVITLPSEGGAKEHFVKMIPRGVIAVAAGNYHTLALQPDGGVLSVGLNTKGQLGDGTMERRRSFSLVETISGAKAVAAGAYFSMVLVNP